MLIVSVEVVFSLGFPLLSISIRGALGLEETAKAGFVGWSEISVPCGVTEANLCLSRTTSSSRSNTLLQPDFNSDNKIDTKS